MLFVLHVPDDLPERHQSSKELFQKASQVIPGGVTANIKYFAPHPIFMERGNGSKLYDVEENEYIDYTLCYGALITGHGHPRVTKAITEQLSKIGTAILGTPHELEITLAEKIIDHYPGIDLVRYTNSGLEATLLAIRLAVAYTNKKHIAKFEGHYHGGFNKVLVSVNPSEEDAGSANEPSSVSESMGMPEDIREQTMVLPFNDLEATEALLRAHQEELAAVILEPIQGGFIPATEEFMHGLRALTKELGIVLIFDEVKTGYRVGLGGAQKEYSIQPDLTALGKVLGGGFPIGAVGGAEEIMMLSAANNQSDVFAVGGDSSKGKNVVFHSGTYNGHPIVLAAGLETIHILEEDGAMEKLFAQTNALRTALEQLYQQYGIAMHTLGMGSIFNIIFSDEPILNYRDMWKADTSFREEIDTVLLTLGIYVKPLNRYSMSTVHTSEDIQTTVDAHEKALKIVLERRKENDPHAK